MLLGCSNMNHARMQSFREQVATIGAASMALLISSPAFWFPFSAPWSSTEFSTKDISILVCAIVCFGLIFWALWILNAFGRDIESTMNQNIHLRRKFEKMAYKKRKHV